MRIPAEATAFLGRYDQGSPWDDTPRRGDGLIERDEPERYVGHGSLAIGGRRADHPFILELREMAGKFDSPADFAVWAKEHLEEQVATRYLYNKYHQLFARWDNGAGSMVPGFHAADARIADFELKANHGGTDVQAARQAFLRDLATTISDPFDQALLSFAKFWPAGNGSREWINQEFERKLHPKAPTGTEGLAAPAAFSATKPRQP